MSFKNTLLNFTSSKNKRFMHNYLLLKTPADTQTSTIKLLKNQV